MNYKVWVTLWIIFATSIVYWDIQRHEDGKPVSACHHVEIKMINDRAMCTECKLYCEVVNEKK